MNLTRVQQAIKTVAETEGVSLETVVEEIEQLISNTYTNIIEKGGQEILEIWHKIPKENELPTAFEFVDFIVKFVDKAVDLDVYCSLVELLEKKEE